MVNEWVNYIELCKHITLERYERGDYVYLSGDEPDGIYLMVGGEAVKTRGLNSKSLGFDFQPQKLTE